MQQTLCRSIFVHLVTPERTRAVRNLHELGELAGNLEEVKPLINELVDSRLLVVQTHSDAATVEIVHESLILNWPTLRRWLDASHEDSQFLDQLLGASHQWDANKRGSGLLWSGEMVDELNRFLRRYKGQLPKLPLEFVAAIRKQARRRANIRRALALTGVLVIAAIFSAGTVALIVISQARSRAEANEKVARSKEDEARKALDQRIVAEKLAAKREEERKLAEAKSETLQDKSKKDDLTIDAQNVQLRSLLVRAQEEARNAEQAKKVAEANEKMAKELKAQAESAAKRERERADHYAERLGLPMKELR